MTTPSSPSFPVLADKFTILGKLAWLWMNSPLHRDWPVELLSRFALPPIELGQYRQGLFKPRPGQQ